MKLLIYSHTDYSDVWVPLFTSIRKYIPSASGYFCVNEKSESIAGFECILYDEKLSYTERLRQIMNSVDDEPFIFMHEDMFLYGEINESLISRYFQLIKESKAKAIKLIPVGVNLAFSGVDSTLFYSEFSKFSIQPTVTSKSHIISILNKVGDLNIWDFESAINLEPGEFIAKTGGERKLGIFHYESLIFPYIATAIVKGKWNFSEYPSILPQILKESNIDEKIRGTR